MTPRDDVYRLYILPRDDEPYMVVPASAVSITPTGRPETIDVRGDDPMLGSVLLRFRPTSPTSRRCLLIAMLSEYHDGYLAQYSRSL